MQITCHELRKKEQEAQLMLTNPRDAFRGKSRSPNIIIIITMTIFIVLSS